MIASHVSTLLRSGSAREYSVLNFCIGPPYSWASIASLEPSVLLYCPPTCTVIIYTGICIVHTRTQYSSVQCWYKLLLTAYLGSAVLVINLMKVLLISALVYIGDALCTFLMPFIIKAFPWFCCEVWIDNVLL